MRLSTTSPPRNASADDPRVVRVLEEYLKALERGEAPSKAAFLANHPELTDQLVECLEGLEFICQAASQAKEGAGDPLATSPLVPPDGDAVGRLGDFRIIRQVGRGGMGVVYEAEQVSLGRRVALKVLPFAATMDPRQLQRFKNEAQAAAHLQHTNIVPVHYVGVERGVHFYAMQYVEGQSLAEVIGELRLAIGDLIKDPLAPVTGSTITNRKSTITNLRGAALFRTVAELGIQAAEALEHAHQMGIIHRDVKPANILIEQSPITHHPSPIRLWITDFGLAQVQSDVKLTLTGDFLGTLRYVSPEQALSQREIVDQRADVYSLGVTLYELLTLRPAFDGEDRQEILRKIAQEEPRSPRKINRAIPAELETIVLKAIEKRPEDRYGSAGDLAADLRRFLLHEPITARRPTLVQRWRKWGRRHPGFLLAVAAAALVGLAVASVSAWLIAGERDRFDREHQAAEANWVLAEAQRHEVLEREDLLRTELRVTNLSAAWRLWQQGKASDAVRFLERDRPAPGEPDARSFEWFFVRRLCAAEPVTLQGEPEGVRHALLSADGSLLATAEEHRRVRLWNVTETALTLRATLPVSDARWVSFSLDGKLLVAGGQDETIRVWNVDDGSPRHSWFAFPGMILGGVVTADNLSLAAAGFDGQVRLWELASGKCQATLPGRISNPRYGAIAPDGKTIAAGTADGAIHVWDLVMRTERTTIQGHERDAQALWFSHSGEVLASGGTDGCLRLWDVKTGVLMRTIPEGLGGPMESVMALHFAPDDRQIAVGCMDGSVHVWDARTGARMHVSTLHKDRVIDLRWTPDGKHLVTASTDGTLKRIELEATQPCRTLVINDLGFYAMAVSPDGQFLALARGEELVLFDLQTGSRCCELRAPGGRVQNLAFAHSGQVIVGCFVDELRLAIWGFKGGNLRRVRCALDRPTSSIAVSADGRYLAAAQGNAVTIRDCAALPTDPRAEIPRVASGEMPAGQSPRCVAFAPDGEVFVASTEGAMYTWRWETGAWLLVAGDHDGGFGRIWGVPQGSMVVSSRQGLQIGLGTDAPEVYGMDADATQFLAISPDGQTLAVPTKEPSVRLVHLPSGRTTLELPRLEGRIECMTFTPDGTTLITANKLPGGKAAIRAWDAPRREQ